MSTVTRCFRRRCPLGGRRVLSAPSPSRSKCWYSRGSTGVLCGWSRWKALDTDVDMCVYSGYIKEKH